MTIDQPDLDNLRGVLDASFGDGPALPAPGDRLAAGHRSLRRRRLAGAGSAATVAAVVVVTFAVLSADGSGPQGADPVAPPPTAATRSASDLEAERQAELDRLASQAQRHSERVRKAQLVSRHTPAALDVDGGLVVQKGWRVTRQVEEPMGYQPPEASLGVVVTDGQSTRWMLLTVQRAQDEEGNPVANAFSSGSSSDGPGKGYSRFEDWLASMVELQGGSSTSPLVSVTRSDEVLAGPGATVVEVRDSPVIADYTSDGDRLALVTREGRTWFVVIRGHGTQAELIPVDADVLAEPSFDALVDHLTQQVGSGEGVR